MHKQIILFYNLYSYIDSSLLSCWSISAHVSESKFEVNLVVWKIKFQFSHKNYSGYTKNWKIKITIRGNRMFFTVIFLAIFIMLLNYWLYPIINKIVENDPYHKRRWNISFKSTKINTIDCRKVFESDKNEMN